MGNDPKVMDNIGNIKKSAFFISGCPFAAGAQKSCLKLKNSPVIPTGSDSLSFFPGEPA